MSYRYKAGSYAKNKIDMTCFSIIIIIIITIIIIIIIIIEAKQIEEFGIHTTNMTYFRKAGHACKMNEKTHGN